MNNALQPQPASGSSTPSTEFNMILKIFEGRISDARNISDGLYNTARTLHDFQLSCDMEKSENPSDKQTDGLIKTINQFLDTLGFLNRRNEEILNHFNTII